SIMEGKPKTLAEHEIQEPALWAILQRGLAKEREQRFGSLFELGQQLAMWLLDQGVTRDICNASLKATWLERSPDSSAVLHSFFPSDAPRSSEQQPPPEAAPSPDPAADVTAPRSALLDDKTAAAVDGVVVESKSRI